MPKSKSGGRIRTSRTEPRPFLQKDQAETEVKYFGLVRDEALGDLTDNGKALAETLKDIQDPAEASSAGIFSPPDLGILDGIERYDLKVEDFEILEGASISIENDQGVSTPLVNPRQRIADRIGQAESFAGRGTVYQGQGTVLYKYYVPTDEPSSSTDKYSHTNPPPFFTEAITSTLENSADFIPTTDSQIESTHRIGYLENGVFVPDAETEYWWSGEYNHEFYDPAEYGDATQSALTNPKYPIVRDGNMRFDQIKPKGITSEYNWGLRFDTWFKKSDFVSSAKMMRWAAQVNGHLRIDYFEKNGYNAITGEIEGTWKTALNTANSATYYTQLSRENATSTVLGGRLYYIQGGPSTTIGAGTGTLAAQRALSAGGALDLERAYPSREGLITLSITSYTGAGTTTVTANMASTTGLSQNNVIRIYGASGTEQSKLNGVWKIASVSPTSFTFVVDSTVASGTYSSDIGTIVRSTISVLNFDNDYLPVVIRFWYGQQSTNSTQTDITTNKPLGPAGFFIQTIDTNLSKTDLFKWNDYSAQLKITYNSTESAWVVDTAAGGSAAGEANFANFNENFEVLAYTVVGSAKPSTLAGYTVTSTVLIAEKSEVGGVTYSSISIPGISPTNGQSVWIVARNRPYTVLPGTSATSNVDSLWQRYLFNPSPAGKYEKALDLLDGVGENYANPDPSKVPFDENLEFYKAVYGGLPVLNTYGPDRYDGMLPNSLTESNTARDYDYNHSKLLMIGRQKKGTVSEIGTTSPYTGKDLASNEVRKKGENYTFIEVVENEAGFGGSITINAYPYNDTGVIGTSSTSTYGKALHMVDNTTTFSKSSRQNISVVANDPIPTDTNFASTARVIYEEIDGQGRFSYGTWNGTSFTYDNTGVIAQLVMGASVRSHTSKAAFITSFKKGTSDYGFYGLIGVQRTSFEGVSLTVNSGGTTITSAGGVFSAGGATTNNNQFIGSQIYFSGDATVRTVTSYNASTGVVTFTPSKTAGAYTCDVWYNHLQMGGTMPSNITDSTGTKTLRTSIIPVPGSGNVSDRIIQVRLVYSSAYQFLRADNGAGLSFAEALYVKSAISPIASNPFTSDTELPAPPADIVVPFGYDNTPASADPGMSGLCYPPYSIQNIELQQLAKNDSSLYATTEGQFDVWWGGRISDSSDLGERYLYVTDKLMFDFAASERTNLLSSLTATEKPLFTGSEYTHKLEVELNVGLPSNSSTATNVNIYNDAKLHSNNKLVKDRYYLFIRKQTGGDQLSVLSANSPSWT